MKSLNYFLFMLILIAFNSCQSTKIEGTYLCVKNSYEMDSSIVPSNENSDIFNCLFEKLKFSGKSTVIITTKGVDSALGYILDGNYIRIKMDKSDFLLKVLNSDTLKSEGYMNETFVKIKTK